MGKKIRLAMIGLGRFAEYHAIVWQQRTDVEIVALCDQDKQQLQRYGAMFPAAKTYTGVQTMLTHAQFEAVDILTPEHSHYAIVRDCLQAGVHVFVEKPLTTDVQTSAELIELAERMGKLLMVGHVLRFDPRYNHMKGEVDSGRFGTIRSMYARRNNAKSFFSLYNRVSPIFILGIHDIDLMHWFTGSRVEEVYATATYSSSDSTSPQKYSDCLWAMLKFSNGTIGVLENNWLLPEGSASFMDVRMEIVAEDGIMSLRDPDEMLSYYTVEKASSPSLLDWHVVHGRSKGTLFHELDHFIECIRSSKPSMILQLSDALEAVKVAYAIQQSIQIGKPVQL